MEKFAKLMKIDLTNGQNNKILRKLTEEIDDRQFITNDR